MHAPLSLRTADFSGRQRSWRFTSFLPPARHVTGPSRTPETMRMSEQPDDTARNAQKRVQPLLDCISYLLAKRWLREQREQESKKPQQQGEASTDDLPT